ncbi:hypothetical protein B0O99DRAFT_617153 [Bisporella sp. PMI_857]|nr:hypothetical protein B0O99DRAFT_617153 [Bisporella sp. PMI_857]
MLVFCPSCANILTVSTTKVHKGDGVYGDTNCLECRSCPYQFVLTKNYYERKDDFQRKKREDILGGKDQWENAQRTRKQCDNDKCDGMEAAFYQVQIRSADEPMTSFFQCTTCDRKWVEN